MTIAVKSSRAVITRAYYTGIGKTAVIYPAAFMVAFVISSLALGLVYYAREMFASSRTQIGILTGIWSFAYLFGCLLLRPRFNRILPRFLMIGSTLTMAGCIGVMLLSRSTYTLIMAYAALGLALSLFWPPVMGWLSADVEGKALSRVLSRFNLAWCSGSILGPLAGGWLGRISVQASLYIPLLCLVAVGLFVSGAAISLPAVKQDRATGTASDNSPGKQDCSTPLRFPAWIALFGAYLGIGFLSSVFPLAGIETWSMNEPSIGFVFTVRGLLNTIAFIALGNLTWWHFRCSPMLAAQISTVVIFFSLAFVQSPVVVTLLIACFGVTAAMSYTGSVFHGASGSLNRARRMVIHEVVLSSALVFGAMGGGWLYERMPASSCFLVVAIVMAMLCAIQAAIGILVYQREK